MLLFAPSPRRRRMCVGAVDDEFVWAGMKPTRGITLVTSTPTYEDCAARHAEESSVLQSVRDRYDTKSEC